MITYANYFEATALKDDTLRLDLMVAHNDQKTTTVTVYMTHANASALAGLLVQLTEKQSAPNN